MNARLYIKPNIIGLQFDNPKDRDTFWTLLGENRVCAETFGSASVRLNPAKAKKLFHIPLNSPRIEVIEQEPPKPAAKPAPSPVPVTALKAPEPIAAIGSLPPEVTGEVVAAPPVVEAPAAPQPTPIIIPEVASISDPKPEGVHPMSKEMRAWRARQKQ